MRIVQGGMWKEAERRDRHNSFFRLDEKKRKMKRWFVIKTEKS